MPATNTLYQNVASQSNEQDADCKCREVQTTNRIRQLEFIFEKWSNRAKDIKKIAKESQEKVCQPGEAIPMKGLCQSNVPYNE
jgi:galactokinase